MPASLNKMLIGQLRHLNQYYEIVAVSAAGPELDELVGREHVRVAPVDMDREISPVKDIAALWKLVLLLWKERPEIVHVNTPKGSLLGMLAAKIAGVPHRIYTVTGLRFETETGWKRRLLINMERITCWAASRVIPEGNGVKETLIRTGITRKELKVLANGSINGIDLSYYSPESVTEQQKQAIREQYNLDNNFVFCFVGRIVKSKGVEELVTAFNRLQRIRKNIRLLILGREEAADPVSGAVLELINTHPNIHNTGWQKDVRPFLAVSNALVLVSYREGFPNVVMQAGAMNVPAIVSDISGCNEIVVQGKNGLIVPARSADALEHAMLRLLDDTDEYNRMVAGSREMITSRFEQRVIWDSLLQEYGTLEKPRQRKQPAHSHQ